MARKAISKGLRFEVFKRDGFRCRYCGATPNQSTLHVDHVIPVSGGGTNDPANLVTACSACNAGKSARPVGENMIPPARSPEEVREQTKQVAECAKRHAELESAMADLHRTVVDKWESLIGPISVEMNNRLCGIVRTDEVGVIMRAIEITAMKLGRPEATADTEFDWRGAMDQQKYFYGVRRRLLTEPEDR